MEFVARRNYEDERLGYSLRYETDQLLKADVFVYDMGISDLQDGIDSPEVHIEMQHVVADLYGLQHDGVYRDVKNIGGGERTFEGLSTRFLWARHSYRQNPGEHVASTETRISETYLVVYRGQFLKVRITSEQALWPEHEQQSAQFIRAIAEHIQKDESGKDN